MATKAGTRPSGSTTTSKRDQRGNKEIEWHKFRVAAGIAAGQIVGRDCGAWRGLGNSRHNY